MKKLLPKIITGSLVALSCQPAFSSVLQLFLDSTFINPAVLATTQKNHVGIGVTFVEPFDKFTGRIGQNFGTVETLNNIYTLPNLQLASRFSEKVVVGMDVSHPLFGNVTWPANGFQNILGINSQANGYEVGFKGSVNVSEQLALGAAFRIDRIYNAQLSYFIPGFGVESSRITGYAVAGAVGFWYAIDKTTFLDGAYFSPVKPSESQQSGQSILGPFVNNQFNITKSQLIPSTFTLNLMHIFNEKFLASVKVFYSLWGVNKIVQLNNVAFGPEPTIFPNKLHNTFATTLFGRYVLTDSQSFALIGLFNFDQSPVNTRTAQVSFPAGAAYTGGLGIDYHLDKDTAIQVMASQTRFTQGVNNPPGFAVGKTWAKFTTLDIGLKMDF